MASITDAYESVILNLEERSEFDDAKYFDEVMAFLKDRLAAIQRSKARHPSNNGGKLPTIADL